jgi:beta-lactamase regulating signal transducer with metallopeptidase domain
LPLLCAAWAAGGALLLSVSLLRYHALERRLSAGAGRAAPELRALAGRLAARLSLSAVPEVLVARGTASALVLGFVRPRVVLPTALAARIGSAELDHVLLHELAHCRRRDSLQGLVCLVLHAAFWFHPLVWWAAARLFALRELCCDQAVVRALGGDPMPYRATLLRHAAALLEAGPARVHAFWHPGSMLFQRLAHLRRASAFGRASRTTTACAATLLLALACVPLGAPPPAVFDPRSLSLDELPGCLQKRYLVLSALAASINPSSKESER